ncbi:helix-turn-helix domain-containing protein [Cobetia marina]|uniref:helix-turn-helix domain-containing protein n=1 Tax=Cobetia marina TaxID=28258 RepID=UPI00384D6695
MSMRAMAWAREAMAALPADVNATPRLTLLLLADFANEQGICWPTVSRLANEVGCTPRTVQRAMEVLVEQGMLKVVPRKVETGRQVSNFYLLPIGNKSRKRQMRAGGEA